MRSARAGFRILLAPLMFGAALLGGASNALLGVCGPFTDTANDVFCPFVLEVFYMGITTGTTATTFDPAGNVTRLQMATFLSRTVDATLKRGSRRAAMKRFWTLQNPTLLGLTTVAAAPHGVDSDGADVWVAGTSAGAVSRVRGSDGRLLETWTGAPGASGILSAGNRVFVTGFETPGRLYMFDPSQPAGAATLVASNLGGGPGAIAFDGARLWTANVTAPGSISIITPGVSVPWTVTTLTVGAGSTAPDGVLYDGSNVWITDSGLNVLLKLNGSGSVLATVTVGPQPGFPAFDGSNLWIPNFASNTVTVVRASTAAVLQTLTGNGLSSPVAAAFDGQRVLVTDADDAVSLWKAADLTSLGSIPTGDLTQPLAVCSDGSGFWVTMNSINRLARF